MGGPAASSEHVVAMDADTDLPRSHVEPDEDTKYSAEDSGKGCIVMFWSLCQLRQDLHCAQIFADAS